MLSGLPVLWDIDEKLCVVGAPSHGKGLMMKTLAAAMDAVVFA